MKTLGLPITLFLACCAYLPQAWTAPVDDVSDPPGYLAPTASELASINLFLGSIPAIPAGSIFTGLRNAPATQINTGLDALAPPQLPEAQHNEVGTLPLPTTSHDCPASTPVTITISDSTVVMTARTFPAFAGFGIGTTILDSRNPSVAAAVSSTLLTTAPALNVGVPAIVPSTSYIAMFSDLPFYTAITGFEVSESVQIASVWEVAQVSYDLANPPSITYQYDDSACSLVAPAAVGIPVFSHLQMAFLLLFMAAAGLLFFRRVEAVRS